MSKQSLLDYLREKSNVCSDTLDVEIVSSLGSFIDNTSNQAIAFAELSKPRHEWLMREAVDEVISGRWDGKFPGASRQELAVDVATIKLCLLLAPHVNNVLHIQVSPFYSYSAPDIVAHAHRIAALFEKLAPPGLGTPEDRLCIKIPSTYAGLLACRTLEQSGIRTLATTLFCMEQVVLAGRMGCTYIAPYVNELKVHFEKGYVDPSPNFDLCVRAQMWYARSIHTKTSVLAASLTSIKECVRLAGIDYITIAPALLEELSKTSAAVLEGEEKGQWASLYADKWDSGEPERHMKIEEDMEEEGWDWIENESKWRLAMTRRNDGREEKKLIEAINIFCDMQLKLEALMQKYF